MAHIPSLALRGAAVEPEARGRELEGRRLPVTTVLIGTVGLIDLAVTLLALAAS